MKEEELRRAVQAFVRNFGLLNQDATPCGQPMSPSQAHALQVLGESESLTLQGLADCLHLDKSTASRMISQLVARQWVRRVQNPENRREVLLGLSEQGETVLADIMTSSDTMYRSILGHIPVDQHEQVLEALRLLTAAVKKGR